MLDSLWLFPWLTGIGCLLLLVVMHDLILIGHLHILILNVITAKEWMKTQQQQQVNSLHLRKTAIGEQHKMDGWLITKLEASRSRPWDQQWGWRGKEGERRGREEASQVRRVVRRVWDGWGTFEVTGGIFNTGIDHRGVLTRGFQGLCYSLLVVSSATGAEVEKSTSLFKTTHRFWDIAVECNLLNPLVSPFLDSELSKSAS